MQSGHKGGMDNGTIPVQEFQDKELLLKNAPSKDDGMFQIPKVIN